MKLIINRLDVLDGLVSPFKDWPERYETFILESLRKEPKRIRYIIQESGDLAEYFLNPRFLKGYQKILYKAGDWEVAQ